MVNFLKVSEIAKRLKVSERTVYNWIDSGYLRAYKLGGVLRVREDDLANFIKVNETICDIFAMRRPNRSKLFNKSLEIENEL